MISAGVHSTWHRGEHKNQIPKDSDMEIKAVGTGHTTFRSLTMNRKQEMGQKLDGQQGQVLTFPIPTPK